MRYPTPLRRDRSGGFTLIELAVVVCVVALMATALLDRLWRYQEMAEKAGMEYTLTVLRTALTLETAHMLVRGGAGGLDVLVAANPMAWMSRPPPNYLGELDAPPPPGSSGWYYDRSARLLVYVPKRTDNLEPMPDGGKVITFRVTKAQGRHEGAQRAGDGNIWTPVLVPVHPYRWFAT